MHVPYKIVSLAEADSLIDCALPVFADTETVKFYGKVRLIQLYQKDMPEVLLVEWPEPISLAAMLSKYNTKWHNAHYDITTIQQQTETRWMPENFDDTFLLARLAMPQHEKFSLDETFIYTLGYCPYEKQGLNKKLLQKSDWSKLVLSDKQLAYAATDVYFMPALWDNVCAHVDDINYVLDKNTLKYCLDFQWNGMAVDNAKCFEVYETNQEKLKELNMPINVNSWQQVRPYIGEDESDDIALAKFSMQGNTRAANVRTARKLLKQLSFLDKFDTRSGKILGKFKPTARSGRLTSNDQNLQQIPRALKKVFGYPNQDRVLVYSDYAQLELRTICAIVNCTLMEKLFREGEDLHGYTAQMVFGDGWDKTHRQISKTYNFNLLYGGGIGMIITILLKTVGILQDEGETNRARRRWRNLWKEIYAWQEKGIANWRIGKLGSTPLGRRYKAKMMTDQLNIENQGAGAEVAKLALHYMYRDHMDSWTAQDAYLGNFIHDSFIADCPNDPAIYEPIARQMAECMQLAWFEMSRLFKIKDLPMPVDVKVGYNWGDIEDDDVPNVWDYKLEPMAMLEKANATI